MTGPQPDKLRIGADVVLGQRVKLVDFVNLYGCEIGDDTRIGTFVEIQRGAKIGARCKISSHTFICEGVRIEDEVFIGHGVMFVNDRYPRAANADGSPKTADDWHCEATIVEAGASIGSGSTILGGHYHEVISGLRAQDITIRGEFILRRVSDIPVLIEP